MPSFYKILVRAWGRFHAKAWRSTVAAGLANPTDFLMPARQTLINAETELILPAVSFYTILSLALQYPAPFRNLPPDCQQRVG